MEKTILIAGKDAPLGSGFADGFASAGWSVAVTGKQQSDADLPGSGHAGKVAVLPWNRTSPISARSLILEIENTFNAFDVAVFYFDAPLFTSQFTSFTAEDVSRSLDAMIAGFQYLTLETLSRFERKHNNGKIVYLLKSHPTIADALRSSVLRGSTTGPAGPLVAAAQAAFCAFAENTAVLAETQGSASVVLVSGTAQNDVAAKDETLAAWLSNYLESLSQQKTKQSAHQAASWVKAGAKAGSLFSRLR